MAVKVAMVAGWAASAAALEEEAAAMAVSGVRTVEVAMAPAGMDEEAVDEEVQAEAAIRVVARAAKQMAAADLAAASTNSIVAMMLARAVAIQPVRRPARAVVGCWAGASADARVQQPTAH